ncbi:hypothetical protein SME05J_44790 [Serratia marcescens]|uniref:hypothetical protein n=1 Tax=Serratia sp. CY84636 TaxID=3383695 RepID=UPI003F9F6EE2|nr:hypothetical protein SME05J_44790 [Serratia marcescens]
MKAGVYELLWRYRYGALMAIALFISACAMHRLFFTPRLPECSAVMRVANHNGESRHERVLLLKLIPHGTREATLLLNGSFLDGNNKYVISRVARLEYHRLGDNYTFWVKSNIRNPQDTLVSEALNRRLPMKGQQYHVRIEQVDASHFLFVDNLSPYFVCSVAL